MSLKSIPVYLPIERVFKNNEHTIFYVDERSFIVLINALEEHHPKLSHQRLAKKFYESLSPLAQQLNINFGKHNETTFVDVTNMSEDLWWENNFLLLMNESINDIEPYIIDKTISAIDINVCREDIVSFINHDVVLF